VPIAYWRYARLAGWGGARVWAFRGRVVGRRRPRRTQACGFATPRKNVNDCLVEIPDTRYAWNGDISLAYQVIGNGDIDLLFIPSGVSNVEVMWESARFARFLERLASFSRLIVMDRRGCGCSERFSPKEVAPLEVMVDDVIAVLDDAGSERTAAFGCDDVNFILAMLAASRPDRLTHAIFIDPSPTFMRDDEITWEWSHREWDEQMDRYRRGWGRHEWTMEEALRFVPSLAGDERELRWLTKMQRLTQSPGVVVAEARKYCETDIRSILPSIHVPSLVLRKVDDDLVDERSPRYVADHIPDARFVEIPGGDHVLIGGDAVVEEIDEFVTGVRHAPETNLQLATVLFTDIVGSTEKQASLGDHEWKNLVEEHHRVVRATLARWRGIEYDTAGDGFFASFDGPARAIRCAMEAGERVQGLGLEIRSGVHTGECEFINDKVGGIAVTIGARISALAQASEILISQTVKDLVAGSGLIFEDTGEHELKGVPDRWHLYRVAP
jgi:class 3 adenylate cyclase/pimeloyl-ACP methyl ester carboxylesterase